MVAYSVAALLSLVLITELNGCFFKAFQLLCECHLMHMLFLWKRQTIELSIKKLKTEGAKKIKSGSIFSDWGNSIA